MNFCEQLNEYILQLNCTAKSLAEVSGLSSTAISRYRAGTRIPAGHSEQISKLATGIALLAAQKQIAGLSSEKVRAALIISLSANRIDQETFRVKFNNLISVLEINMTDLAHALRFDASYLSRIRSGQRKPANTAAFANGVGCFVVRRCSKAEERAVIAELIGTDVCSLSNNTDCLKLLVEWLLGGSAELHDNMGDFLKVIDEFNLEEYISALRFNDLIIPPLPLQPGMSRNYYGLEAMKQGELDFFNAAATAEAAEPIFMCSDMPMEDLARDLEFGKQWMMAIAITLKKGLQLNIIHNIERPFREMMLGLESWIPLYMTGQVAPYYLKGVHKGIYEHLNYVSAAAALTGECIDGFHKNGKYYLTQDKTEVAYYKQKATDLLSKASPLMEVYRKNNEPAYQAFVKGDALIKGSRRNILSLLPIYTISEVLLTDIMHQNAVSTSDGVAISAYADRCRSHMETILQHSTVIDEITPLSREEFAAHPLVLSLSGMFYEKDLYYTYEQYSSYLQLTRNYAAAHPNYSLQLNQRQAFRNMQISVHEGRTALISKNKTPVIHFIIRHSKMLQALENFVAPVTDSHRISQPTLSNIFQTKK